MMQHVITQFYHVNRTCLLLKWPVRLRRQKRDFSTELFNRPSIIVNNNSLNCVVFLRGRHSVDQSA